MNGATRAGEAERERTQGRPTAVVHIVHRKTARREGSGCSISPDEEGLMHSDEILPVEEAIHAVHGDETAAHEECAELNETAAKAQTEYYGEVVETDTWTVTSILVEDRAQATAPAVEA